MKVFAPVTLRLKLKFNHSNLILFCPERKFLKLNQGLIKTETLED